ncbi:MAG: hypothetical protein LBF88_12170 [Planctomycetaceae bacterium]|jgi:hypothetical protein|nr:hypothetical protein [Planctomycetaceae bacterium]
MSITGNVEAQCIASLRSGGGAQRNRRNVPKPCKGEIIVASVDDLAPAGLK